MTSNALSLQLADAVRQQAVAAGQESTTVRGSDWRMATVATVGTDGTVTTTDGIVARRMDTYASPAVSDLIYITISSAGNWAAWGRAAPSTTAGTWQALSFAGSWSAWGSPYYTPAYRINGDRTVQMCGLARAPAATTGASTVGTLPTAARPASKVRFPAQIAVGILGVIDINTDGTVVINDYTGNASWAPLDVVRFRLS
ncbi:hypothetical protein ACFUJR_14700 [Streptomyces sp. NPDC057271]|uniref:hypothetical protein n=1 Tax=unclassified Streptomyces TaxID=2593676 RepID=UPI00362E6470